MNIGDRIKVRRMQLGLSQEELAAKLGYKSRSTINKIELGINDITQSKVASIAKALDTTPAYLMGWDDASTSAAKLSPEDLQELDNAYLERIKQIYSAMASDPISIEICDIIVNRMDYEMRTGLYRILKHIPAQTTDDPDDFVTKY